MSETTQQPTEPATPSATLVPWFRQFRRLYNDGVSHAFLLHWNTADYVLGTLDLRAFLSQAFRARDIILFYNRAEGITFPYGPMGDTMRERFIQATGLGGGNAAVFAGATGATGPVIPREPGGALPLIAKALQQTEMEVCVVLDHIETLAPNADVAAMSPDDRTTLVMLQRWARNPFIAGAGHPIILVASNLSGVHPELRAASSRIAALEVPLPDYPERLEYIRVLMQERPAAEGDTDLRSGMILADGLDPETFARLTAGLARVHLEDISLHARNAGEPVSLDLIRNRKREIVAQEFSDALEVVDPETCGGFDTIGGLARVKEFFSKKVIGNMRHGRFDRVPMGVLMLGPAGTGKTQVARAVAREAGMNFVNLNLAKIFGSYVGQSERNLERALKAIDSMWPTVVFIDEIDQSIQRSGGQNDSGVSSRVFKRLLEYMSDTRHRGRVLFLAATNRPDMIDAALKRPGRMDVKIPFLPPDEADRAEILRVFVEKLLPAPWLATGDEERAELLATVAAETEGWTGAELEAVTAMAADALYDDGAESLLSAFRQALDSYRPTTQNIVEMSMLAVAEVTDKRLLPDRYHAWLEGRELDEEERLERAPTPEEAPERAPRKRSL